MLPERRETAHTSIMEGVEKFFMFERQRANRATEDGAESELADRSICNSFCSVIAMDT